MWADRVTVRRHMGCSPYFTVTGTHPLLPLDIAEATYLLPPPNAPLSTTDLIATQRLVREKAEREVREEAERVARRERRQQEKLELFLNESITAEEFKKDLEAEAEESEVTGVTVIEDKVGAQVSEMEVDDAGEDEVVVEGLKSKGGRKRAPSSPPKPSRKRTRASTAIGSKPAVIERTDSSASAVTACDRCRYHNIKCTPTDAGARCSNC